MKKLFTFCVVLIYIFFTSTLNGQIKQSFERFEYRSDDFISDFLVKLEGTELYDSSIVYFENYQKIHKNILYIDGVQISGNAINEINTLNKKYINFFKKMLILKNGDLNNYKESDLNNVIELIKKYRWFNDAIEFYKKKIVFIYI